jgi:hypothetical protein
MPHDVESDIAQRMRNWQMLFLQNTSLIKVICHEYLYHLFSSLCFSSPEKWRHLLLKLMLLRSLLLLHIRLCVYNLSACTIYSQIEPINLMGSTNSCPTELKFHVNTKLLLTKRKRLNYKKSFESSRESTCKYDTYMKDFCKTLSLRITD